MHIYVDITHRLDPSAAACVPFGKSNVDSQKGKVAVGHHRVAPLRSVVPEGARDANHTRRVF